MNKSQNQAQASSNEAEYFNLHASGCGYLSRMRWVNPDKRGGRARDQFLACAINALRGEVTDPNYTYFDLRVSGEEAIELVSQLMEHVDADAKVFVAFKLGDFYSHHYERDVKDNRGRKTGEKEWTSCIKGRLLLITHAKVNDEVVYTRDDNDEQTGDKPDDRQSKEGEERPAPADAPDQAETPSQPVSETRERSRFQRRPSVNRPAPVDRTRVRDYA